MEQKTLQYDKAWPQIPGYYWKKDGNEQTIVEVFVRPGHTYLCIENPDVCKHTKSDYWAVQHLNVEWAGPIPRVEL